MKKLYLVHTGALFDPSSIIRQPLCQVYNDIEKAKEEAVHYAKYGVVYVAEITNIMEYASTVTGKSLI